MKQACKEVFASGHLYVFTHACPHIHMHVDEQESYLKWTGHSLGVSPRRPGAGCPLASGVEGPRILGEGCSSDRYRRTLESSYLSMPMNINISVGLVTSAAGKN